MPNEYFESAENADADSTGDQSQSAARTANDQNMQQSAVGDSQKAGSTGETAQNAGQTSTASAAQSEKKV